MWRGFEYQLAEYGKTICLEWIGRGYKDTCYQKISDLQKQFSDTGLPPWFGDLNSTKLISLILSEKIISIINANSQMHEKV
jgi:hypothetical protein